MPSGNILVDLHDLSDYKSYKCHNCNGTGYVPWDDMEKMIDEVSHICWKRKKQGNPVTTFREALRVARIVKAEGMECPSCDGCGEVEA